MAKSLTEQLDEIFANYPEKVAKAGNDAAREAAELSTAVLKATSPKRKGKGRTKGRYARGWKLKPSANSGAFGVYGYTVYNSTDWQLTHLLERGHVIRNGKGTYGRTKPIRHIAPAEDAGIQRYELSIKARIKKL